jgi:acyl-homoserine lactone acylase PvdQ
VPVRVVATIAALAGLSAGLAAPAVAQVPVAPYQANDGGGIRDVLPPGTNGSTNALELGSFLSTGARPRNNDNQLGMYGDLVYATPGLTQERLGDFFKDASFGIPEGQVERTYSPRSDVTIQRDRDFGVPRVTGSTREGAMFGLGYIAAEDRLFFMDVLRNAGRGRLSSFAGGAAGNRAMDATQWKIAPYTEADLTRQYEQFPRLYGPEGQVIKRDIESYVEGVNQYLAEARVDPTKLPGEYAAIGQPGGPEPWRVEDVIATASLVGGIFGKGGGDELAQAELLQSFAARFGARTGRRLWREWGAYHDPDAPTTVRRDRRFPYQSPPKRGTKPRDAEALPDRGSLKRSEVVAGGTGSATPNAARGTAPGLFGTTPLHDRGASMSNALAISAKRSATGRPIAVWGPQTGYFSPQVLMEQEVHAPGIDARGAAFLGVNLYVQLGRGRDYSWSATSAGQDIIDTFAVELCEPGGGTPTLTSQHYRFRGACEPVEVLERQNAWQPTVADDTPAGTETLRTQRTKLGLVTGRATLRGVPVLYTQLRTTYMHEVDSARGFKDFNDPDKMRDARDFQRAAHKIGYTFSWLYADDRDIAFFNSGENPVRARGIEGFLPTPAKHEWRGFDPDGYRAAYTPFEQHPQFINGQDYVVNWNNKLATSYAGGFTSTHRSKMLTNKVEERLRGDAKMTLPQLVDAMEDAGVTDLRAEEVLPLALRVLGTPSEPRVAEAVAKLRAWVADGAQRRDRDRDGVYEHADAIRILDAWWPVWMRAQFEPVLGEALFERVVGSVGFDNAPNNKGAHLGSAYQGGLYGYAVKDLRTILGAKVRSKYARRYCGRGRRAACRTVLERSLGAALENATDERLYADDQCAAAGKPNDQLCFDAVFHRATGGITQPFIHWINRPTYQQAVSIERHRPRP